MFKPNVPMMCKNLKDCASDLEYRMAVWEPHMVKLQNELENVQNRAEMSMTGNYN